MKKTFLKLVTLVTICATSTVFAQVGVGVPAGDIHPSAELEVKSSTKGFLPPRMTKAQRIAMIVQGSTTYPAAGLLVFQTDGDANEPTGLYFFDGTAWRNGAGVVGAKGDKGDKGETGAQGLQGTPGTTGPAGNGFSNGTSKNQMMYWNGSAWVTLNPGTNGQVLTVSDGDLIWTLVEGYGKPITDIDGNEYRTVNIGNQQWMAENLKVSHYNDGTDIPNIQAPAEWSGLSTGAWAYYNDDAANYAKYGKLYNWYAVSPDNKNVCPKGWHVPTDAEWTVLTEYLGGASIAGGKLKEVGTTSWKSPNTEATNTSLFSALPGGYRINVGSYVTIGYGGYWWSSSEDATSNAWNRSLTNSSGSAYRNGSSKKNGFSVRCLRD